MAEIAASERTETISETVTGIRRDNVEYHNGRTAWQDNQSKDSNPYFAGGIRAERWDLGWQEACDAADPISKPYPLRAALDRLAELLDGWPTLRALSASGAEDATARKREARLIVKGAQAALQEIADLRGGLSAPASGIIGDAING